MKFVLYFKNSRNDFAILISLVYPMNKHGTFNCDHKKPIYEFTTFMDIGKITLFYAIVVTFAVLPMQLYL